jgi:DNA polymerase (family 10)
VLEDGTLDLPDACLAELDFVVASVHAHFALDTAAQTRRVVRALGNPFVTILGHPTGRLLLGRPGFTFDLDEVARAAAASGVCLEINASPQRLDLSPPMIRRAAELGARFCINPDAHDTRGIGDVPLGIAQARRAALPADRILNTRDLDGVLETLRARRDAAIAAQV